MRGHIIEIQEMYACQNVEIIIKFIFIRAIPLSRQYQGQQNSLYFSLFIIFSDAAFKLKEKQQ